MNTQNSQDGDRQIGAVGKAFKIVEALDERESAGVSELASAVDMPTSTVHAYLQTLVELGYVLSVDGNYRLSLRFLEIGGRIQSRIGVLQAAQRDMIDICQKTGETVGLGVMENGKRVQLWQIEGEDAVNDNIHIGEYTRPHWTSLGKVLLAGLSDDEVERLVARQGLPRATEKTITNLNDLLDAVEQIRRQGYALEDEERKRGIRSVSVSLTDDDGTTVAALGINAPKIRMPPGTCDEFVALLEEKANIISIRYSY